VVTLPLALALISGAIWKRVVTPMIATLTAAPKGNGRVPLGKTSSSDVRGGRDVRYSTSIAPLIARLEPS